MTKPEIIIRGHLRMRTGGTAGFLQTPCQSPRSCPKSRRSLRVARQSHRSRCRRTTASWTLWRRRRSTCSRAAALCRTVPLSAARTYARALAPHVTSCYELSWPEHVSGLAERKWSGAGRKSGERSCERTFQKTLEREREAAEREWIGERVSQKYAWALGIIKSTAHVAALTALLLTVWQVHLVILVMQYSYIRLRFDCDSSPFDGWSTACQSFLTRP